MAYISILEKTSNSGTYQQRMYITNVDNSEEEIISEFLTFLRSQKPAPGINVTCTWEYFLPQSLKSQPRAKTVCFRQMEEIDYVELRFRRSDYGDEIDSLTGFDYVDFNNDLVKMMKQKGWKLTQYFRDGFLPTRQWTFYKGPLNDPETC